MAKAKKQRLVDDGSPVRPRRITLKDVAREAGVHMATASRAMADSPLIPVETRQKVKSAAEKLGYERDPMLQALVSYRKTTAPIHYHGHLAWLLTDHSTDEFVYANMQDALAVAQKMAKPLGYLLEEFHLLDKDPGKFLRQLASRGITGILFPPQVRPGVHLDIDLTGFSAVKVGETLVTPRLNTVLPNQYGNMQLFLGKLREAGWRKIGFYLPKVIDCRTAGSFSAAYWRWQQDLPREERLEVGLPEGYDPQHFRDWVQRVKPASIVGMPEPSRTWLQEFHLPPLPVVFPANLTGVSPDEPHIDENWAGIYSAAIRLLDGMIRHGERGIPEIPRRIAITGRWVPGKK